MSKSGKSSTTAIAGGVVAGLIVTGAFLAVTPWRASDEPYPIWAQLIGHIGSALEAVAAGFGTGYLLRRPSFLAGAVAGVVCIFLISIGSFAVLGEVTVRNADLAYFANILFMALAASLTNGVAGIAGGSVSHGRGTTALRREQGISGAK